VRKSKCYGAFIDATPARWRGTRRTGWFPHGFSRNARGASAAPSCTSLSAGAGGSGSASSTGSGGGDSRLTRFFGLALGFGFGAFGFGFGFGGGAPAPRGAPFTTTVPRCGAAAAARATAASRAPGTGGVTTGDGAGGAAPSNNPCTGKVEACRGGLAGGLGFFEAMRPQLSVCFAAPCSLANHRPHSRAQGVAPQASQERKGMTSGLGMVNSRVQIWQATVWGKGFERQASAMVFCCVAAALFGVLDSVRPRRTGSAAQAPWGLLGRPVLFPGLSASARRRLGVRGTPAALRWMCSLAWRSSLFAAPGASYESG
jgi:hypothetical protein